MPSQPETLDAEEVADADGGSSQKDGSILEGGRDERTEFIRCGMALGGGSGLGAGQPFLDHRDDIRKVGSKGAVNNNDIGIEDGGDIVDGDGHVFRKRPDGRDGRGRLTAVIGDEIIHSGGGKACQFGILSENRRFGSILFDAAAVAAGAGASSGFDDGMTKFTGKPASARIKLMIQDQAESDSRVDAQINHVGVIMAEGFFSQCRKVGFIFDKDRNVKGMFQLLSQRQAGEIIVGTEQNGVIVDSSVYADRDAYDTVYRRGQGIHGLLNQ